MRIMPARRIWTTHHRNDKERAFLGLFVGFLVIGLFTTVALLVDHSHLAERHPGRYHDDGLLGQMPRTVAFVFVVTLVASVIAFLPMASVMYLERRFGVDLGLLAWIAIGSAAAYLPGVLTVALLGAGSFAVASACSAGGFAAASAYVARSTSSGGTSRNHALTLLSAWAVIFTVSYTATRITNLPAHLRASMVP